MKLKSIKLLFPVIVGGVMFCFQNCSQPGALQMAEPETVVANSLQNSDLVIEPISLDQVGSPPESFVQPAADDAPPESSEQEVVEVSVPAPAPVASNEEESAPAPAPQPIQVVVVEEPPVQQEEPKSEDVVSQPPQTESVSQPSVATQDPVDPVDVVSNDPVPADSVPSEQPVASNNPTVSSPELNCDGSSLGFSLKVSRIEFQCKTKGNVVVTKLIEGKNIFDGANRIFEFSMDENYDSSCMNAKIHLADDSYVLINKSQVMSLKSSSETADGMLWFSGSSNLQKNKIYRLSNLKLASGKSPNEKLLRLEKGADGKCYMKGKIHLQGSMESI